jgi:hypothetical protein
MMEARTKELLNLLDEEMAKGGRAGEELAAIMSGLRGPDCREDEPYKERSTCRIRAKAFPKMFKAFGLPTSWAVFFPFGGHTTYAYGWTMNNRGPITLPSGGKTVENHFSRHALMAADALGEKVVLENDWGPQVDA